MTAFKTLWLYLQDQCITTEILTFDDIYCICGHDVDNTFMECRKEALEYGISVVKVDLRNRKVHFARTPKK